ncbi:MULTISPECIES: tripartite tricarboxylate transporter substrate binding protein [unclassified Cupriavidus]|uniref:Bug family tripartite tricarboxylate transporter substrate binding protein n=1 Tax=unclassified Cupriavidus TaxID=2640874 RepID=UPI001C003B42|nr:MULTISPECIES: tripartite tricarboxylate transporter substrate binding protein [unclassified Cupriavidus]MCA3184352.1 tripartite tricarboxylate transporter substrate binding protein [Cupriavidus sp.]MCA3189007.1 tripartite tricarboxylate transporter substrate binding protein [Cupriavidus sp.]MCA3198726.1 tripartite tricarboxylate transporter substrate binding protein [Cupriavidus sp.]MCA3201472.1 tripartite tricarboxylate transporter substrate binding protein [Cupriavidus sp.]MCA3207641.1 tr
MRFSSFRSLLSIGLFAASSLALAQGARDWPTQPVRIVVPFQAGSATDLITRQLGAGLAKEYGQSFVVENRPGAAAMIGSEVAARASGDGYTLLMSGPASMVTNRFLYKKLSYDPDAFEKVAVVAITPNILLSNPSLPFKTLPEMVAYAKANPGKLSYASFGTGTTSHIAGEMLKAVAGIDIVHVPYKGAGEAIPALLSGQVSMYFDTIMTGLPYVKAGKLRALGMSTAKRSPQAPEIPTIAEQGFAGFDIAPWYGIVAPKGTPADVVVKLNTSINKLLAAPDFREKLAVTGAEPRGGSVKDFTAMINAEIPRTEKLVKQSGVALQ